MTLYSYIIMGITSSPIYNPVIYGITPKNRGLLPIRGMIRMEFKAKQEILRQISKPGLENGDLVDLPSEKKHGGSVQFVFCERLPEGISTNQMDEEIDFRENSHFRTGLSPDY